MIITGFLFFDQAGTFSSAVRTACIMLLLTCYFPVRRHLALSKILDLDNPGETAENLEIYIHKRIEAFSSTTVLRIVFGIACAAGMVLIMYYNPSSPLGATFGLVLVYLVLLSMLIGWINMQDSIMLQDLKHCLRNHPSEIS